MDEHTGPLGLDSQAAETRRDVAVIRADLEGFITRVTEWRIEDQKALHIQATEYERRLLDLNNSHEKAIAVQNTYVDNNTLRLEKESRLKEADDLRRKIEVGVEARAHIILDLAKLTAQVGQNASDISALTASQTWLTRILIGSILAYVLSFVFRLPAAGGI